MRTDRQERLLWYSLGSFALLIIAYAGAPFVLFDAVKRRYPLHPLVLAVASEQITQAQFSALVAAAPPGERAVLEDDLHRVQVIAAAELSAIVRTGPAAATVHQERDAPVPVWYRDGVDTVSFFQRRSALHALYFWR